MVPFYILVVAVVVDKDHGFGDGLDQLPSQAYLLNSQTLSHTTNTTTYVYICARKRALNLLYYVDGCG